ncbi:hypothetical protein BU24DRAFT_193328 [Aaosphaeria arxii CBS 175.79]|uniref:Uncharacterized protein n=1 Tax=Aaosphaeria arxii CBS 175.79 TaxID=1450172 RepID=A0A6A5XTD9_9PLEO|nr:uncharacterized protein BU24DRAFT_193328 [Aaosphaeria arxii CBS 175.79]KAF2016087.1 hypothetical protein BU24DRAFT_193328 [Aaosphaeria arxii CBS 175.79]
MKNFAAAILAIVPLIAAAPACPAPAPEVTGNVRICTGENYTGTCISVEAPNNQCQQLSDPYLKNVGSFKVSPGWQCRITYSAETCTLHGDAFIQPTPSAPNLHEFNNPATGETVDAGNQITSYLCQECTACQ